MYLRLTFNGDVGETQYKDLISLSLIKGDSGVGIKDTSINEKGEVIITYTDDTTQNLGKLLNLYLVNLLITMVI
ncbi:MAG TPA: hypothetical protein GXZ48_04060 [Acholeplasmataceae bacterium]|nr:hypothetical protein [Acholeplasmataceae bacterium]